MSVIYGNTVGGITGTDGKDGVSVTHSWNGTVLSITSASGTSSVDLKGEKGDTGAQGTQGEKGDTGATGAAGADGKSAYAYAVEGGYTGTESEFANKLAAGALIVTVTDNNGTLTADKTYYEIITAFVAGSMMFVMYDNTVLPFAYMIENTFTFGLIVTGDSDGIGVVGGTYINITDNGEVYELNPFIEKMPNPNALTFTGAVIGTYDGSSAMTVNIPSAVTDDHINELIDAKLGVIENGAY